MKQGNKITILIDADPAAQPTKSGVGYYTNWLIESLSKVDPDNIEIVGHYFNFLGRNKPKLYHSKNVRYKASTVVPRQIVNSLRRNNIPFPYELLTRIKPDFIIFSNFLTRQTFFTTPYSQILHDFTYLDHPEFMSKKNKNDLQKLIPKMLHGSAFAITISNTSKQQLLKHYPEFKKPVVAGLLPIHTTDKNSSLINNSKKFGITKSYILLVGNIEPRKNLKGAIRAYLLLPENIRILYSLVVVGGNNWGDTIDKDFPKIASNQDIIFTGYVSDEDKRVLYVKASLFLFPSFYEGYGMPVIEAMQLGVPVAISDIEIHREVAKNAAVYFNPSDPQDIADKIETTLTKEKIRKTLLVNSKVVINSIDNSNFAKLIIDQIRDNIT